MMSPLSAPRVLQARHISQRFGGLQVLDDVSFSAQPGEVLGLIGPNGAGKTSLLNVLSGLARPTAGEVLLGDVRITPLSPQRRARLGLVRCYQSSHIFPEHSLVDNLALAIRVRPARATGAEMTPDAGDMGNGADAGSGTGTDTGAGAGEIGRAHV